jgi:putative hydrolase of the HAD superfamily
MSSSRFQVLYSDVGGVLGTNGWDTPLRQKITAHFRLQLDDIESRHHLMFDSYERGYMSFEDYLRAVFFNVPRAFTLEQVRDYTYNESVPWPANIQFFKRTKDSNRLKIGLVSNEGRGLTEHRVRKFHLRELADFMIFSHCVGYRKPDREIWRLALDLAQVTPGESLYLDDRKMFVEIAADMGFTAVHYISLEDLSRRLQELGLAV